MEVRVKWGFEGGTPIMRLTLQEEEERSESAGPDLLLCYDMARRPSPDARAKLLDFLASTTTRNKCPFFINYQVCGFSS